jgi:hypothetical protein
MPVSVGTMTNPTTRMIFEASEMNSQVDSRRTMLLFPRDDVGDINIDYFIDLDPGSRDPPRKLRISRSAKRKSKYVVIARQLGNSISYIW